MTLRCYARRTSTESKPWLAHCVDLDIWAVGDSALEAQESLHDSICVFVETVLDSDDKESIDRLLHRRASFGYVALWNILDALSRTHRRFVAREEPMQRDDDAVAPDRAGNPPDPAHQPEAPPVLMRAYRETTPYHIAA